MKYVCIFLFLLSCSDVRKSTEYKSLINENDSLRKIIAEKNKTIWSKNFKIDSLEDENSYLKRVIGNLDEEVNEVSGTKLISEHQGPVKWKSNEKGTSYSVRIFVSEIYYSFDVIKIMYEKDSTNIVNVETIESNMSEISSMFDSSLEGEKISFVEWIDHDVFVLNFMSSDLIVEVKNSSLIVTNLADCPYDKKTQTDSFLKGIPDLQNYTWDRIGVTATVQISENEMLKIKRGGCVHFGVSATYYINTDTISNDLDFIFKKIRWVVDLLKDEFHYDLLISSMHSQKFEKNEDGKYLLIRFTDETLLLNNYVIHKDFSENKTVISIGWYY